MSTNKLTSPVSVVFIILAIAGSAVVFKSLTAQFFLEALDRVDYGEKADYRHFVEISKSRLKVGSEYHVDKTKQERITSHSDSPTFKNIYFEMGKSDIPDDQLPYVDLVGHHLLKNPNCTLLIDAFTDSQPGSGESSHPNLSRKRGESIKRRLGILGIKNQMIVIPSGNGSPKLNADGTENHQKSRRSEFKFICPSS